MLELIQIIIATDLIDDRAVAHRIINACVGTGIAVLGVILIAAV